jgi:hypothetical protein
MIALRELIVHRELGLEPRTKDASLDVSLRWAHVIEELDAISALDGEELVLSEASWYRQPGDCEQFVVALVQRGGVALVLAPRKPIAWGPVVAACERWNLPLLEIVNATRLETVAEFTESLLLKRIEYPAWPPASRAELFAAALESGGGAKALLDAVRVEFGLRAWLVTQGAVFSGTGDVIPPDAELARLAGELVGDHASRVALGAAIPLEPSGVRRVGRPRGHLVVERRESEGDGESRTRLEQLAAFANMHLAELARVRAARRHGADEVLRRLGAGGSKGDDLRAWLRTVGIVPRGHATCIVLQAIAPRPGDMEELAVALEDMAASIDAPAISVASEVETVAIVVLPEETTDTAEAIGRFMLLAESNLQRIQGVVGTSSVIATDASDLVRALVEARQVCRLNAFRQPECADSSTAPAEPSLAVGLLYDDDDAREALHDAVLLPLVDYDENHNSDLVRTLDAFLSHNGTWNTTAAELQVHVNTLRYRLARVEDLTGRSLDSMGDRVDFFVALRTRR